MFCVGQLVLGRGPPWSANDINSSARGEYSFFLSQQVSPANSFLGRDENLCPLPLLRAGSFIQLNLCEPCACCHSLRVHIRAHQSFCVWKIVSLESSASSGSHCLSASSSTQIPEPYERCLIKAINHTPGQALCPGAVDQCKRNSMVLNVLLFWYMYVLLVFLFVVCFDVLFCFVFSLERERKHKVW